MEDFIRLEISATDRLGMTMQILEKLYEAEVNLHSIEVFPEKVFIKGWPIPQHSLEQLYQHLREVEGVKALREIELLNYEKNERKLLAIIDSVDEGIIAVNRDYEIEIFNNYCSEVFHYHKDEAIGRDIRQLISSDLPIVSLIQGGNSYDNVEIQVQGTRGQSHYITTGRSVTDDHGGVLGAVASIKDIHKALELVDVVSTIEEGAFKGIVGNSPALERVKSISATVAKSDSTVLLRGESGTGKELFARAIHSLSRRRNRNFVTINCAALPDSLIESELFGYERGSFTGALTQGKEGLFKEADGGTLFLDEIAELSIHLQAKLLRVLQEGVIRKIGSTKEEKIDVRIVAATSKNLEQMLEELTFREDLYYRLNVVPIRVPALRERQADIPALINYFIKKFGPRINRQIVGASSDFVDCLMAYDWPGNIRELQNVVERAMNMCGGTLLTIQESGWNPPIGELSSGSGVSRPNLSLSEAVEMCERQIIVSTLADSRSYREAAKRLGISHTTIMNKAKKYGIVGKFNFHT